MGKKSIVSVTYENEKISVIKIKKNSLPYITCVLKSRYLLIRWHSQGLLGPLEVWLLAKRSR